MRGPANRSCPDEVVVLELAEQRRASASGVSSGEQNQARTGAAEATIPAHDGPNWSSAGSISNAYRKM
jgi:hypothetical protein